MSPSTPNITVSLLYHEQVKSCILTFIHTKLPIISVGAAMAWIPTIQPHFVLNAALFLAERGGWQRNSGLGAVERSGAQASSLTTAPRRDRCCPIWLLWMMTATRMLLFKPIVLLHHVNSTIFPAIKRQCILGAVAACSRITKLLSMKCLLLLVCCSQ